MKPRTRRTPHLSTPAEPEAPKAPLAWTIQTDLIRGTLTSDQRVELMAHCAAKNVAHECSTWILGQLLKSA
jgi:hypothetical protein